MSSLDKRDSRFCWPLSFRIDTFSLPKSDHTAEEYEDAFAFDAERARFALADGASEAIFARQWALLLVQSAIESPPRSVKSLIKWLNHLQQLWQYEIDWKHLPWFAYEKARRGAFSTLLMLHFHLVAGTTARTSYVRWRALAVGDSCLFHLRNDKLLEAFPVSDVKEFGNYPALLSSQAGSNRDISERANSASGFILAQDLMILATDALANWLLGEMVRGSKRWKELISLASYEGSQKDFQEWIFSLRHDEMIRDDDVTAVIIRAVANT